MNYTQGTTENIERLLLNGDYFKIGKGGSHVTHTHLCEDSNDGFRKRQELQKGMKYIPRLRPWAPRGAYRERKTRLSSLTGKKRSLSSQRVALRIHSTRSDKQTWKVYLNDCTQCSLLCNFQKLHCISSSITAPLPQL